MTQLVVPPRLPDPPADKSAGYLNALLNVLRLYFNRLSLGINGLLGPSGAAQQEAPYAMFMSDADQVSAGVTSENLVTFNQTILANDVSLDSPTQIRFGQPGQYLITCRLNFANQGTGLHHIDVWAKYNGSVYPLSSSQFDIQPRKSDSVWAHTSAGISGIFTVADPDNDFLSIAWWSDGADVVLEHYAAGTSPARPAAPSVILNATFVSRLPAQ
jgi:hypothetical protein